MVRIRQIVLDSLKESVVFAGIGLPVAILLALFIHVVYIDAFGFVLLIESCGLMLLGGAMDIAGSPAVKRFVSIMSRGKVTPYAGGDRDVAGAAVYTVTGVILFISSLAVAVFLAA
ncbi:MAG TPA: hypothetical protein VLY21_00480 [Nitrososphaerales archaeon]|nr:hypothetical protein [Nitrososphaerales archaeon]